MPELPEVETVVRSLLPLLRDRWVETVWTSDLPLHMQKPVDAKELTKRVCGGRVVDVRRRGKYVLIDVAQAKAKCVVLVHLGMSGKLTVASQAEVRKPHTHVVLGLQSGFELRFVDPRRFGQFKVAAAQSDFQELAGMGPEPMTDLTVSLLAAALSKSRAPLKSFLLDQKRIAGLGNIYVSEALFEAALHPGTLAMKAKKRSDALFHAVRLVLQRGIENKGTTLRDYVDGKGVKGTNQHDLRVYGREGEACLRCGGIVRRRVDAGRSTFFCAGCQKR